MLKVLSLLALTLASASAFAYTTVPYGEWTWLPNCEVSTRLSCTGSWQSNQCSVEFSGSSICQYPDFYVNSSFYPKNETSHLNRNEQSSFYVDGGKVNPGTYWARPNFRVYLHNPDKTKYDQVKYEFNY
jgi:hypothetical protein